MFSIFFLRFWSPYDLSLKIKFHTFFNPRENLFESCGVSVTPLCENRVREMSSSKIWTNLSIIKFSTILFHLSEISCPVKVNLKNKWLITDLKNKWLISDRESLKIVNDELKTKWFWIFLRKICIINLKELQKSSRLIVIWSLLITINREDF